MLVSLSYTAFNLTVLLCDSSTSLTPNFFLETYSDYMLPLTWIAELEWRGALVFILCFVTLRAGFRGCEKALRKPGRGWQAQHPAGLLQPVFPGLQEKHTGTHLSKNYLCPPEYCINTHVAMTF